nr:hypothetical protein [Clostridia bacterium]
MEAKHGKIFLLIIIICILGFILLRSFFPVVDCKIEVPDDIYEVIVTHSSHVFSERLPLIPVRVTINDYYEGNYYFTISYFPFGKIDEAYGDDGFGPESKLY